MASTTLERWLTLLKEDLWGRVLPFWLQVRIRKKYSQQEYSEAPQVPSRNGLQHSVDATCGGFFNCLDEDGAVYDTSKHIWLQGRQTWMFAKIANLFTEEQVAAFGKEFHKDLPPVDAARSKIAVGPLARTRDNLKTAAIAGADFLRSHAVRKSDGQVYFCLSREGKPVALQRKPFAATFMIIALNEVGRLTGDSTYRHEALELLDRTLGWIKTPGSLGREALEGTPELRPLNVPMIILNVIGELSVGLTPAEDAAFYPEEKKWCAQEILAHIVYKGDKVQYVLENVGTDGKPNFDCIDGRVINPGHAIEAGWFLLDYGNKYNDAAAKAAALAVIDWGMEYGIDENTHGGGIIYFKDAEGYTPPQLEWSMKLWWPHNEAMIATAMAYRDTLNPKYLEQFDKMASWAFEHLVDKTHGEWFGYCDRDGTVTHRFKGGPYKGCFHVPRCLLMSYQLLEEAAAKLRAAHAS